MSSRALKRLQKKNNFDELSLLEEKLGLKTSSSSSSSSSSSNKASDQTSTENTEYAAAPKKTVNLFAMFDDEESEDETEDEDEEELTDEETQDDLKENSENNFSSEDEFHDARETPMRIKQNGKSGKKRGIKEPQSKELADEDFDTLIDNFQKQNLQKYYTDMNGQGNTSGDEDDTKKKIYTIKDDPGFTKFKQVSDVYGLFSSIKTAFLDPQTELKSLFDDIPSSLLNETTESSGLSQHQQQQLKRMKRLIKNWATGKNKKTVPNGPSLTRQLMFSNVRDDWLPTQRGELHLKVLNDQNILDWNAYLRPNDWLDVIKEDLKGPEKPVHKVKYYKFEPLSREQTSKNMVEFYMSVVLHPDHEALISLIQSQAPYFVPGLLQVATVLVRQGDRSNSNGLVERALFVFDRALKNGLAFNGVDIQLPYIYFFNRQFYLGIFQYIGILEQRGCIGSAANWCKVLWSLSPCEDPLGCRYFIDHYLLQAQDYKFLIDLSKNKLFTQYKEWQTFNLDMSIILSLLKLDLQDEAVLHVKEAMSRHPYACREFFIQGLNGNPTLVPKQFQKLENNNVSEDIQLSFYLLRMKKYWNDQDIQRMNEIMSGLWNNVALASDSNVETDEIIQNERLYLEGLEINLLRFTLLSQESSIMHKIPSVIFDKYQIFDYDVLPPPYNEEVEKIDQLPLETVNDFINQKDLVEKSTHLLQDQNLLDMIQRMSLQEYVADNEIPEV